MCPAIESPVSEACDQHQRRLDGGIGPAERWDHVTFGFGVELGPKNFSGM